MSLRLVSNSKSISAIGYDAESHALTVVYKNGQKYRYADVPTSEYGKLLQADSIGGYVRQNIRSKYEAFREDAKPKG